MYTEGDNLITIPLDSALDKGDFSKVTEATIYINIRTLTRNIINSWDGEVTDTSLLDTFAARLIQDISLLREFFKVNHRTTIEVYDVIYSNSRYPGWAVAKVPTTDKQKALQTATDKCLVLAKPMIDKVYESYLKVDGLGDHYVITHYIVDLINLPKSVKLIESHTGAIKSHAQFNTKLNISTEQKFLVPFNKLTYFIFGDNLTIGKHKSGAKELLKSMEAGRITPVSTYERLRYVFKEHAPMMYNLINKIKY